MSAGEIRAHRLELGLHLREVARRSRVDAADLCRLELGKPCGMSQAAIARVLVALAAEASHVRRSQLENQLGRQELLLAELMEVAS